MNVHLVGSEKLVKDHVYWDSMEQTVSKGVLVHLVNHVIMKQVYVVVQQESMDHNVKTHVQKDVGVRIVNIYVIVI